MSHIIFHPFSQLLQKSLSTIKLTLSFTCPPYDRILPLADGRILLEGIELNYLPLAVEEVFWRQLRNREFDISESSLSSYVMLKSRGDERFIAIPVFTSRFFRHSCVFINAHKGIHQPQDLKGKLVGLPEYQITAVVWLRGILQDDYAVYPQDIQWRSGGEETPGRKEKISVTLPWIHPEVERTIAIFGEDWWPYGIEKNRKTLETFLRYHKEQGLSDRLMTIEDLFAFETLDEQFKI